MPAARGSRSCPSRLWRVRPLPRRGDVGPQRALAAALDHAAGRLEQDGEVPGQQLGPVAADPGQPVALGLDLLAVVEHVGHVPDRAGQRRGQAELDGHPGLHVGGSATVEAEPFGMRRKIAGHRDGIDVPGQDHPLRPAQRGARHHGRAVGVHGQVRQRAQRRRDLPRQPLLRAADRLDIGQRRGQGRAVGGKVKPHRRRPRRAAIRQPGRAQTRQPPRAATRRAR